MYIVNCYFVILKLIIIILLFYYWIGKYFIYIYIIYYYELNINIELFLESLDMNIYSMHIDYTMYTDTWCEPSLTDT